MENKCSPDSDKQSTAKRYSHIHQILSVIETVFIFSVLIVLIFTGLSKQAESFAFTFTSNKYIALLIFLFTIGVCESVFNFPIGFYSGYILEHKYGLSNQTLKQYFMEKLKGIAIGLLIGVPMILIFYFILFNYPDNWWIILGIVMFTFSVILGRLAPTVIMPLFYKFRPVENENVQKRIHDLCEKTGMKIRGIFTFDMSKNTKKANAAFTGIGKSKRIIIGDTLMNTFSEDEIETVFAHEVGHYKNRHILKLMSVSTILTFAGLYLTSKLYEISLGYFNFNSPSEIAALPLLFMYLSLYSLVTTPVTNILSRKYEWEADTFALETTRNKISFISAMEKLADQNLAEKTPNKMIEFLFHSHPSLEKRIQFARSYPL